MEKLSLFNLVNKYIEDEKKRHTKLRSKSAICKWIIDDVRDLLVAINDEYRQINNKDINAKKKFRDKIIGEFETKYFKNFLKNKSETVDYYDKLLNDCLIHVETIEDFLNPENDSNQNPRTLDFFRAFCKYQEREYGKETSTSITRQKHQISTDVKIETVQISGATIIDEDFIDQIKKKNFSMAEFYTAKLNEDCQWFGILQNFDVIRNAYDKIKEIVQQGFKDQSCRVSAIIYGNGGCGKSTLLRRLAIDLSQEESQDPLEKQIRIIWLNNNEFEDFYTEGLPIIEQTYDVSFLIIIEDWFRITENDKKIAYKFLKKTNSISNIRIIIGDRVVEKKCKDLLDGEPILLSPDENESIITKIIENNNTWRDAANQLFADKTNYQCSLFLLLFIMAYASQNENTELNFSKPRKAFVDIIENDLKVIANADDKKYKGLAKALYYWACIYEKHRNFITYDTFLAIADHYNENKLISKYFSRWEMSDPILDRLKIYINKNYSKDKYFLQFNHDILADEGLSKVDWGFSDTVKIDLLEVITDFGDDYSASEFLATMCFKESQIFENHEEKLIFIKKLINNKNQQSRYILVLTYLQLDDKTLEEFAHLLWKNRICYVFFWSMYFARTKNYTIINDYTSEILNVEYLSKYNSEFINYVVGFTKNISVKNSFIDVVLRNKTLKISPDIVRICLFNVSNEVMREIANKVLQDRGWVKINKSVIERSMLIPFNYEVKQNFSNNLLKGNDWKKIDSFTINLCLEYAKSNITQSFSLKFLQGENWKIYNDELICNCLLFFENKKEIPTTVYNFIENIIKFKMRNKNNYNDYRYCLFSINFYHHSFWRKVTQNIIKDWRVLSRNMVTNTLRGYRFYPDKIYDICLEILIRWRYEIFHTTSIGFPLTYGKHIEIALGHPLLRPQVKVAAIEMLDTIGREKFTFPESLKGIAIQIVENDIYPEWEI